MPEQESHAAESSPAALITAIAALVAALGGIYVAVREPDAEKVSAASEAISKASQDEHDQLVKLIQAVDDLSKNSDQNHDAIEGLQTYVETTLAEVRQPIYVQGGRLAAPAAPVASAPPPPVPALKPVVVPQGLAKPPLWNSQTHLLER